MTLKSSLKSRTSFTRFTHTANTLAHYPQVVVGGKQFLFTIRKKL